MTKLSKQRARILVGLVPPGEEGAWLAVCREAVADAGLAHDRRHVYDAGEVGAFIRDLRPHEVAVVSRLAALDERPTLDGLPVGEAFWLRLTALRETCAFIVDADADGLSSRDGDAWLQHAHATYRLVTKGRTLTPEKARAMALKSRWKRRAKAGSVARLRSRARRTDWQDIKIMWTSNGYPNAGAALAAIGAKYPELEGASRSTIERITKVGRNGKAIKYR